MAENVIEVVHFSDPGCPWAYSASPALATLRWRYGSQLNWRLTMIGLAENADRYEERGYTPEMMASYNAHFRDEWGMPFDPRPKSRLSGTGYACRVVVAARRIAPELELAVFRALQFTQFATAAVFDDEAGVRPTLELFAAGANLDVDAVLAAVDDEETEAAYQADRAETRTAAGGPTEFQGKSANSDGAERYTAPSLLFKHSDGRSLEAGGFQPIEAYDVCVANLDATLERRGPAEDVVQAIEGVGYPLTTAEVAAVMAPPLTALDPAAAEVALVGATAAGLVHCVPVASSALWLKL
ncbi:MAG TPA: DsbA family protein [Baekduia sp.]|nr:DsbA family protein [Baekduia sp.]